MNLIIMGGGLAGLSLAYFLQNSEKYENITIIEQEERPGGLCRSLKAGGFVYDIGPHILFSKDKEMLRLLVDMAGATCRLRRSNIILHKGSYVQYPFENDLSKLPPEDLDYCVKTFLQNPYIGYEPRNMLQFFLKTFGEGITNLYLRPYNEKIWKHDPCFMDTQMVDRIPKPTDEELMRSAHGETVDGYVHQLYFDYPSAGGIESVIQGIMAQLGEKCQIITRSKVTSVNQEKKMFTVEAGGRVYRSDTLVSTIPPQELVNVDVAADEDLRNHVRDLKYNSIMIALIKTKQDLSGRNFAFMTADKDVIFHRISKIDFLGKSYHQDGACYMAEVTYRQGDWRDQMSETEMGRLLFDGLERIGFIKSGREAELLALTKHPYAYVLYDLNHAQNMSAVRNYYGKRGIYLHGRFGNFEYWNMDRVLRESKELSSRMDEGEEY